MSEISLSKDQKYVLDSLLDWYKRSPSSFITVGGYAGTGKTTLISIFRDKIHLEKDGKKMRVAFCSYTGKAARVLRDKIELHGELKKNDTVSTIHSLIYSPVVNNKEEIVGWELKPEIEVDLIIVDEASMVDEVIWTDLNSYGIPIIAVGDHGQLAPIKGKFNLVQKPKLRLEKIHRQAEGNPIIQLSIIARESGEIPTGRYSNMVQKLPKNDSSTGDIITDLLMNYNEDTMILCGYNNTRVRLNESVRQLFEINSPYPEPGDRVICLRNNHAQGIYNGMTGEIKKLMEEDEDWYYAEIDMGYGNPTFKGLIFREQFGNAESMNYTDQRSRLMKGDLFDFGYAVTVHKAQGSQARRVILFEERFKRMNDEEWRRWLYTAVTRAEEELFIVG